MSFLIESELGRVQPCRSHRCPVSRRINIGSRYQAEVPELRQRSVVELDHHRADLVWSPLNELQEKPDFHQKGKRKYLMQYFTSVTSPDTRGHSSGAQFRIFMYFIDFNIT